MKTQNATNSEDLIIKKINEVLTENKLEDSFNICRSDDLLELCFGGIDLRFWREDRKLSLISWMTNNNYTEHDFANADDCIGALILMLKYRAHVKSLITKI